MKAEERHELQDNDLVSWLQFGLWNFIKQNGSYILLFFALCFLGFQLWRMYERKQEVARLNAWGELRTAEASDNPPKAWLDVIDKYQIKPVQAEAYLKLGGFYSRIIAIPAQLEAIKLTRDESLEKAAGYYQDALDALDSDPLIAGKAHLGLAAVREDQGEWDKAKAEYQLLANKSGKFAGTAYAALATARLDTLDERRDAPRLARMIPKPEAPKPTPSLLGPTQGTQFPGLLNQPFGPLTPQAPSTGPAEPFVAPAIPGILPGFPTTQPTPAVEIPAPTPASASAPAAAPK